MSTRGQSRVTMAQEKAARLATDQRRGWMTVQCPGCQMLYSLPPGLVARHCQGMLMAPVQEMAQAAGGAA